jgi:hypothetical protein
MDRRARSAPATPPERGFHPSLGFLIALSLLGSFARADLVVLRNGQELRGQVRSQGDQVRIELDIGGTVTVARGDIARTVVETPAGTDAGEAEVGTELLARLEERETIHVLIEQLAAETSADRQAAEKRLAAIGRAALPFLRTALDQGTTEQRRHALRLLTTIGDPTALDPIRALLADPQSKDLHVDAATALAGIGGTEAAPELTARLVRADKADVAQVCLKALAADRAPIAAPFILDALQRPALRPAAWAAARRWGDPVLLPYVLARLERARTEEARTRAAAWLADLITPGHVNLLSKLLEKLQDTKPAAKALFAGVQRLHKEFPVAGDVALLEATQLEIRQAAHKALKSQLRTDRPPRPRAWRDDFDRATQPRVLLLPVGKTPRTLVRDLAAALDKALARTVAPGPRPVPFPGEDAPPRDARRLLLLLDRQQLDDNRALRVIGVTSLSVRVPGLSPALAPTQLGGSIVLSLGALEDADRRGAVPLALHALARSFGVQPCTRPSCPGAPLYRPEELSSREPRLCSDCAKALSRIWEAEAEAARFRYAEAGRRLERLAGKDPRRLARAAFMYERGLDLQAALKTWATYQELVDDAVLKDLAGRRIGWLETAAESHRRLFRKKPPADKS